MTPGAGRREGAAAGGERPAEALAFDVRVDPPTDAASNMARDHALAAAVRPGRGALRLYGWSSPTLSFGRNEPARGRWDRERASALGIGFVRRPTGGRAVLHDGELTYALAVPLRALGGLRPTYRLVNLALRQGLARLGVDAEIAPSTDTRAPSPDAGACFRRPAPGELTVAGRKLVGSAQARVGEALLQHGSLLIRDDQARVDEVSLHPRAPHRPATLLSLLGREPEREALVEALLAGFAETLGGRWRPAAAGGVRGEEELRPRYADRAWTWRR